MDTAVSSQAVACERLPFWHFPVLLFVNGSINFLYSFVCTPNSPLTDFLCVRRLHFVLSLFALKFSVAEFVLLHLDINFFPFAWLSYVLSYIFLFDLIAYIYYIIFDFPIDYPSSAFRYEYDWRLAILYCVP